MVTALLGVQAPAAEVRPAFELVGPAGAVPFVLEAGADRAVVRASDDVRHDIERVSGQLPARQIEVPQAAGAVFVGVAGQSALLDRLTASGKLDLKPLAGAWETFVVAVVTDPVPGVERALVVAGSDRRGAIYGLYEISGLIGVSPWTWWADVPVPRKARLAIPDGSRLVGPPSVKYRGIFINDEDWGLLPWAAHTFEPETGNLGPKTYAKIFELVLRLRGNLVWPGMHPTTQAFNHYPQNKEVADAYGIVMGSSHAEPMLRNNVGEWTAPAHDYNYVTNRAGVLRYWEQRVAENGRYENIYTLGMRGIHDSLMQGPRDNPERVRVLEQIFADQRELLARYVRPEVTRIPQLFCAYKEVLELYRLGLRVPADAIFVWPDDNFGYIRAFPSEAERARPGGAGVYYHLSYLGRPLSYLWLATTPPALIWQQMHQAYEQGEDRLWVANVGDIKPGEIAMEFFLQMAWDIKRWTPRTLPDFLPQWAAREFGETQGRPIAALMAEYYRLNFQRKPEHLQWWPAGKPREPSPLTDDEVRQRLRAFDELRRRSETVRSALPAEVQDAYYELVHYPIAGSTLANERYFFGEQGDVARAQNAHTALVAETRRFNEEVAGGKWRGLIALEPADNQWTSMRIAPWQPFDQPRLPVPTPVPASNLVIDAGDFVAAENAGDAAWTVVPGLGRTGRAVTVLPTTAARHDLASASRAPRLDFAIQVPAAGEHILEVHLLPTHPIEGPTLRLAVAVDDDPPRMLSSDDDDGPQWAQGVLNGIRRLATTLRFTAPGQHTLHLFGTDAGIVVDRLVLDFGANQRTYLGPDPQGRDSAKVAP